MEWKIFTSSRSLSQNNKNRETASGGLIESLFSKQIILSNKKYLSIYWLNSTIKDYYDIIKKKYQERYFQIGKQIENKIIQIFRIFNANMYITIFDILS